MSKKICNGEHYRHDWIVLPGRHQCTRCCKLNPIGQPPFVRFWDHVGKPEANGCRIYKGPIAANGYGVFTIGRPPTHHTVMAHRYAYVLMNGPIPFDMDIDHLCKVRGCCEPTHMELVTHKENMARRAIAGKCKRGHVLEGNRTRAGRCKTCYAEGFARRKEQVTA